MIDNEEDSFSYRPARHPGEAPGSRGSNDIEKRVV